MLILSHDDTDFPNGVTFDVYENVYVRVKVRLTQTGNGDSLLGETEIDTNPLRFEILLKKLPCLVNHVRMWSIGTR